MKIEKLIEEYQKKIRSCDYSIERLSRETKEHRRESNDAYVEICSNERKMFSAKRQCYVQFIADLETMEES